MPGVQSSIGHITAIAAGANHTIALLDDGTVWGWGQNDTGELGFAPPAPDERGDESLGPVQVPGLSGIVAIAADKQHNLALTDDGFVWAWGANDRGQLGDSSRVGSARPVPVEGIPHEAGLGGSFPIAVAAGFNHSLVVVNAIHESTLPHCGDFGSTCAEMVYAWGANDAGQLGDGRTVDSSSVELLHVRGVSALAGGEHHSVALNGEPFWPGIFAAETPDSAPGPFVRSGAEPPPGVQPPDLGSGTKLSLTVPTTTATPRATSTHRPETQATTTPVPTSTTAPTATPVLTSTPVPTATSSATPRATATSTPTPVPIMFIVPATSTPTLSPIR